MGRCAGITIALLGFGISVPALAAPPVEVEDPPAKSPTPPPPPAMAQPAGEAGSDAPADPLATSNERTVDEETATAWSYSTGSVMKPRYEAQTRNTEFSINPIGYYQGVTTTGDQLPPFAPQALGEAAVLTWTGFELHEEGSRVFFQLSTSVMQDAEFEPNRVRITLPNTSVNVRNNKRYLDTRFFETPVRRVAVRRSGSNTVITIDLRGDARAPNVALRPGSNGYQMLVVDFEKWTPEEGGEPQPESVTVSLPSA